jgi:spore cortex biosynthesis protein YabQ
MTLTVQFYTMLAMIGMGSLFGAALDTYNRFLNRPKRKRWLVFLNDILFWILQALFIFYILFIVNFGEIRFYIFIALLCGFAAYQAVLKHLYLRFLEAIIQFFISLYNFIVKMFNNLIFSPIKWLILLLLSFLIGIGKVILSILLFSWKIIKWILKIFFTPLVWVMKGIWSILPKNITKNVEKLYNKIAGISSLYIKKVNKLVMKLFNKKEK